MNDYAAEAGSSGLRTAESARERGAPPRSHLRRFLYSAAVFEALAVLALCGLLIEQLYFAAKARVPRTAAERALMDAEAAVEADPDSPAARAALAKAYAASGLYESAEEQALIGLQLDKNSAKCWYALGLAQKGQGDLGAAVESFEKAIGTKGMLADFYSDAYYRIGEVEMSRGRYAAAAEAFANASRTDPNADADVLYSLAVALEKAGKRDEAAKAYRRVLRYLPGDEKSLASLKRLGAAANP